MPSAVAVKFRSSGRIYYYEPNGLDPARDDAVIVETSDGLQMGTVAAPTRDVAGESLAAPLEQLLRLPTDEDRQRAEALRAREAEARQLAKVEIKALGLPMKLVDVEWAFDGSKATFYFTAEGRVDFRELVRGLTSVLRVKVHLHQIGARDAARYFDGMGVCGRQLCCSSWIQSFEPIGMKMAKEQALFLNPSKYSGVCGKLMCCLRYEYDTYREIREDLPALGKEVATPHGPGKVIAQSVVTESVTAAVPGHGSVEIKVAIPPRKCKSCDNCGIGPALLKKSVPRPPQEA